MHSCLLRNLYGSAWQTFWKLPLAFVPAPICSQMKGQLPISLHRCIVAELPKVLDRGLGARLLFGSYYVKTVLGILVPMLNGRLLCSHAGGAGWRCRKMMRGAMGEKAEAGS